MKRIIYVVIAFVVCFILLRGIIIQFHPNNCNWARDVFEKDRIEHELISWIERYVPKSKISTNLEVVDFPRGPGDYRYFNKHAIRDLPFSVVGLRVELRVDSESNLTAVFFVRSSRAGIVVLANEGSSFEDFGFPIADQRGRMGLYCVDPL